MRMRTLYESLGIADTVRSLTEDGANVLKRTLQDFANEIGTSTPWVLVGGLAVGHRAIPTGTQDIDVLVMNESAIDLMHDTLKTFKHHRRHSFEHRITNVEVEVLTAAFIKIPEHVVTQVFAEATTENGIPVASAAGLTAMKLISARRSDLAGIERIFKSVGALDLSKYRLAPKQLQLYDEIISSPSKDLTD